jgi:hypothetical protein
MSETKKLIGGGGLSEYLDGKRYVPAHGLQDDGARWVAKLSTDARRRAELDEKERERILALEKMWRSFKDDDTMAFMAACAVLRRLDGGSGE